MLALAVFSVKLFAYDLFEITNTRSETRFCLDPVRSLLTSLLIQLPALDYGLSLTSIRIFLEYM